MTANQNGSFAGKVALVTGANRGMGLETCRALAQQGYQVVLTSRDQRLGQQATHSFVQQELSVSYFALDVTDAGSIQHGSVRTQKRAWQGDR